MAVFVFALFVLISTVTACDRCVHKGKAAYFSSESALQFGACSYGPSALGFNNGYLAAVNPTWFKYGAGCGSCFQIRCKDDKVCSKSGTTVMATDLNTNNMTDFVLANKAFQGMANKGMGQELMKYGLLDVEYKRVPCNVFKTRNLAIRVEPSSRKPNYLSIVFLYQVGQTEIVAVDVAQAGSSNWFFMSRNHGAVWDTSRFPTGALQFRMVVTAGFDGKTIWANKAALPADWKPGMIYDAGVQITDIAQEACSPCDTSTWN